VRRPPHQAAAPACGASCAALQPRPRTWQPILLASNPPVHPRAVQAHAEAGSDPGRPRGAVRQALCAALQRELTEFYGFLAGLEQQLQHPLPPPGARAGWKQGWAWAGGGLASPSAGRPCADIGIWF
jgi:hypothetical protein